MPSTHGEILKATVEQKGWTIEAFRKTLGVSRQTVYNYFEKVKFDDMLISELENGGIENAKELFKIAPSREIVITTGIPKPVLGDLDFFGGDVDVSGMDISEYVTEYISVPFFNKADYYVNVRGQSMWPRYSAGDIIAIKEVKDKGEIQFGQVYAIITPENRVLKYVRKGSTDKKFLLTSENPKHDDYEVEKDKVKKLFLVLGKITKDVL